MANDSLRFMASRNLTHSGGARPGTERQMERMGRSEWMLDQAVARGALSLEDSEQAREVNPHTWWDRSWGYRTSSGNQMGEISQPFFDTLMTPIYVAKALTQANLESSREEGNAIEIGNFKLGFSTDAFKRSFQNRETYTHLMQSLEVNHPLLSGLGLDIALDPMTYLTFGVSAGAKVALKSGTRVGQTTMRSARMLEMNRFGEQIYNIAARKFTPIVRKRLIAQNVNLSRLGSAQRRNLTADAKFMLHNEIGQYMVKNFDDLVRELHQSRSSFKRWLAPSTKSGVARALGRGADDFFFDGQRVLQASAEDMFTETARALHKQRGLTPGVGTVVGAGLGAGLVGSLSEQMTDNGFFGGIGMLAGGYAGLRIAKSAFAPSNVGRTFDRTAGVPEDIADQWFKAKGNVSAHVDELRRQIDDNLGHLDTDQRKLVSNLLEAGEQSLIHGEDGTIIGALYGLEGQGAKLAKSAKEVKAERKRWVSAQERRGLTKEEIAKREANLEPGAARYGRQHYASDDVVDALNWTRRRFSDIAEREIRAGYAIETIEDYVYHTYKTESMQKFALDRVRREGTSIAQGKHGFTMHRKIATIEDALVAHGPGSIEEDVAKILARRESASVKMVEHGIFRDYIKGTSAHALMRYDSAIEGRKFGSAMKKLLKNSTTKEAKLIEYDQVWSTPDSTATKLGFREANATPAGSQTRRAQEVHNLTLIKRLAKEVRHRVTGRGTTRRPVLSEHASVFKRINRLKKIGDAELDVVAFLDEFSDGAQDYTMGIARFLGKHESEIDLTDIQKLVNHMDDWARKELNTPLGELFPSMLDDIAKDMLGDARWVVRKGKRAGQLRIPVLKKMKGFESRLRAKNKGIISQGKPEPQLPNNVAMTAKMQRLRYGDFSDVTPASTQQIARLHAAASHHGIKGDNLVDLLTWRVGHGNLSKLSSREADGMYNFMRGYDPGHFAGVADSAFGEKLMKVTFGGPHRVPFIEDVDLALAKSIEREAASLSEQIKNTKLSFIEKRIDRAETQIEKMTKSAGERLAKDSDTAAHDRTIDNINKLKSQVEDLRAKSADINDPPSHPTPDIDNALYRDKTVLLSMNKDTLSATEHSWLSKKFGFYRHEFNLNKLFGRSGAKEVSKRIRAEKNRLRAIQKEMAELDEQIAKGEDELQMAIERPGKGVEITWKHTDKYDDVTGELVSSGYSNPHMDWLEGQLQHRGGRTMGRGGPKTDFEIHIWTEAWEHGGKFTKSNSAYEEITSLGETFGIDVKKAWDDAVKARKLVEEPEKLEITSEIFKPGKRTDFAPPQERPLGINLGVEDLTEKQSRLAFGKLLKEELTTPRKVLDHLAANATSASHRELAAELSKVVDEVEGLTIKTISKGDEAPLSIAQGDARGIYQPDTETILLRGADLNGSGVSAETILHELVHATTVKRILSGYLKVNEGTVMASAVRELEVLTGKIIQAQRKVIKESMRKGWTPKDMPDFAYLGQPRMARGKLAAVVHPLNINAREVVAWGMTNNQFQDFLRTIRIDKDHTAYSKFVQIFRKALGLGDKHVTALDEVIRLTDDIMSGPQTPQQWIFGEAQGVVKPFSKVGSVRTFRMATGTEGRAASRLRQLEKKVDRIKTGLDDTKVEILPGGKYRVKGSGQVRDIIVKGKNNPQILGRHAEQIREAIIAEAVLHNRKQADFWSPMSTKDLPERIVGAEAKTYYIPESVGNLLKEIETPFYNPDTAKWINKILKGYDLSINSFKIPMLAMFGSTWMRNAIGNVTLAYTSAGLSIFHPETLRDYLTMYRYALYHESPKARRLAGFKGIDDPRLVEMGNHQIKATGDAIAGKAMTVSELHPELARRGLYTGHFRNEIFTSELPGVAGRLQGAFSGGLIAGVGGAAMFGLSGGVGNALLGAGVGGLIGRNAYTMKNVFKIGELATELPTRLMLGLTKYKQSGSLEVATRSVRTFLHDYSELSTFEKRFLRRIIPFYNFTKMAVRATATGAITAPARLALPYKAFTDQNVISEVQPEDIPDWYHHQLVWLSKEFDEEDQEWKSWVVSGLMSPAEEAANIADIIGPGGQDIRKFGSRGPFWLMSAIEYATNFDTFRLGNIYPEVSQGIYSTPFQSARRFKHAPEWMKNFVRYDPQTETVSPRMAWLLGEIPHSRFAKISQQIYDTEGPQLLGMNFNALSRAVLGASVHRFDSNTQQYWTNKAKIDAMENVLANIGYLSMHGITYPSRGAPAPQSRSRSSSRRNPIVPGR